MLEPYDGKLSCTVLRGGSSRKAANLLDRLLRNKANFGVLEGFLTVLLGEPIRIVEILESEGNQQRENDKFNRVDIKARNSKDEIIIVEVQNTREIYYLERILFGVAKAITEHIELGELYSEGNRVRGHAR